MPKAPLNIFTIFSRAGAGASLSPAERAFLRFLSVVVWGAVLAGGQAVMPLLSSPGALDLASVPWASVAHTFLAAATLAFALGIAKYHTAQGDPPISPTPSAVAASAPSSVALSEAGAPSDAGATNAGVPAMVFSPDPPPDTAPLG